jgi:DNA-binding response OmpR family regulator
MGYRKETGKQLNTQVASKSYRIIVVDDDKDCRYFIRRIIERQYPGAQIVEARDGEEALKFYDEGGADFISIDHQLPFKSGVDFIRELRERKVSIPLVMVSSFPSAKPEAMLAGATFFVDKGSLDTSLSFFLPALLKA